MPAPSSALATLSSQVGLLVLLKSQPQNEQSVSRWKDLVCGCFGHGLCTVACDCCPYSPFREGTIGYQPEPYHKLGLHFMLDPLRYCKVPSFSPSLLLCPADTVAKISLLKCLPSCDASFPRSKNSDSQNPLQNHSPGVGPSCVFCSHLLSLLQKCLSHRKYLLIHWSPSRDYKLHEKKLFCLLITP
jgi:hypothetical protein